MAVEKKYAVTYANPTDIGSMRYWLEGELARVEIALTNYDEVADENIAAIEENTNAISVISGSVDGLALRYGVQLDVNGYVTGFVQNNDGTSGDFTIVADNFRIANPSNPDLIPFEVLGSQINLRGDVRINGVLIDAGTVASTQLATGAVLEDKIAANAVTVTKIADAAVAAGKIAADAVGTAELAALAVTADKVAAAAITTAKIASAAVTEGELANNAVTGVKIAADAVTSAKIAAGTIVAVNIAAGTITSAQIATDTITASNIAAGAISTSELAASAVTAAKIAANTITAAEIAANAITSAELAAGSVIAGKIAAGAVTATEIAAGAVTASKINVTDLQAVSANTGSLTVDDAITVSATGHLKGGQTDFNTGNGFWQGYVTSFGYKWSIRSGNGGNYAYMNGSKILLYGDVWVGETVASTTERLAANTERTQGPTAWSEKKKFTLERDGQVQVYYEVRDNLTGTRTTFAQVRVKKNTTVLYTDSITSNSYYSITKTPGGLVAGDTISIEIIGGRQTIGPDPNQPLTAYIRNAKIRCDIQLPIGGVVDVN